MVVVVGGRWGHPVGRGASKMDSGMFGLSRRLPAGKANDACGRTCLRMCAQSTGRNASPDTAVI